MANFDIILTPETAPSTLTVIPHTRRTTFYDMVEYMRLHAGAAVGAEHDNISKKAIFAALRELTNCHLWSYFYKWGRINTVAPQNTGTIAVDVEGGAFPNLVTLTGSTWPTWSSFGHLRIGEVVYSVKDRVDATRITLDAERAPAADIASGTSYTLYRDTYTLPGDFISNDNAINESSWGDLEYVRPTDWLRATRYYQSSSTSPRWFTITGDPDVANRLALRVFPYPDSAKTIDFLYKRQPREVNVVEAKDGTVSVSSLSTPQTVTGTGTAFTANMVGSVIRFSAQGETNHPTSLTGAYPNVMERNIIAVTNSTTLTLDDAASETITGGKYRISDPIDIDDQIMSEAFFRCCEKNYGFMRSMKNVGEREAAYVLAMRKAKESDQRVFAERVAGAGGTYRQPLSDMPINFG